MLRPIEAQCLSEPQIVDQWLLAIEGGQICLPTTAFVIPSKHAQDARRCRCRPSSQFVPMVYDDLVRAVLAKGLMDTQLVDFYFNRIAEAQTPIVGAAE
jgi:hypothetical protein